MTDGNVFSFVAYRAAAKGGALAQEFRVRVMMLDFVVAGSETAMLTVKGLDQQPQTYRISRQLLGTIERCKLFYDERIIIRAEEKMATDLHPWITAIRMQP